MVEESLKDRQEWVAMFHYKGDSWKKKKRRGGSARKLIFRSERPRREKRSLRGTKKTLSTFAKEATSLGLVLRKRWERARRVRGLKSKRHNAEDLIYRWWRVSFSTDTIFLSLLDSTLSTSVASYFIPNNLGLDVVSTYFSNTLFCLSKSIYYENERHLSMWSSTKLRFSVSFTFCYYHSWA